ncbi:hypothetical protein ACLBKU_05050 [Erythrobacter sp. NE805]|uniref:hypothetical protein n=1 Tax=Erythrobacter sp. NE805 TaxID=3389875 RepID=UPI00396B0A7B
MRSLKTLVVLAAPVLMLAGCGSADDASTEASADTVEMPADSALAPVTDAPVADPTATATDTAAPEATTTETADAAANVAAAAAAAAEESPAPAE